MGLRKRTVMNEEFENLLYSHYWTERIQDQWAQLMKDNNYDHNHYLQAFVGCVLYTLGVYRQADTLGKVFSNNWHFKSVQETSLSNVKVHKCYRRLLKIDAVKTIFRDMPELKPFLLWLVRNPEVVNYCGLCNEFPEDHSPETKERPSAQTRFKKLVEYTNNNVNSLTLEEVLTYIKNRNYRNGRKGQEDDNEMEDISPSSSPSPNFSNGTIDSSMMTSNPPNTSVPIPRSYPLSSVANTSSSSLNNTNFAVRHTVSSSFSTPSSMTTPVPLSPYDRRPSPLSSYSPHDMTRNGNSKFNPGSNNEGLPSQVSIFTPNQNKMNYSYSNANSGNKNNNNNPSGHNSASYINTSQPTPQSSPPAMNDNHSYLAPQDSLDITPSNNFESNSSNNLMPTPNQTPIQNKKDGLSMPNYRQITPKFMNNQERYYPILASLVINASENDPNLKPHRIESSSISTLNAMSSASSSSYSGNNQPHHGGSGSTIKNENNDRHHSSFVPKADMKSSDHSNTSSQTSSPSESNNGHLNDSAENISNVLLSMKEGHHGDHLSRQNSVDSMASSNSSSIDPSLQYRQEGSLPVRKKRKYTKRASVPAKYMNESNDGTSRDDVKGKIAGKGKGKKSMVDNNKKSNLSINPRVVNLINESKKILSHRSIDELDLSEKIDLLPSSLINLLKNGKFAIVKYHGSTECVGIQKCDTMLGKKELKKIKELQFNSNELETSKALRIKFENDSKKSQHRFLIITPIVWKHWDWFNLQNAEIDYTKQQ
ncbi:hypothetical protein U3516DRAFT_828909 [Neocallimastix sp. 'constans']